MVAAPEVNGVTRVETWPVSSLRTVQLVAPAQAEKFTGGDAVRKTLAPLTGVAASARTCTRIGLGASPPMGVAGLDPLSSLIASDGPAPTVRTSDIEDEPPVAGRSEEHTSELQSQSNLVCRLLLEKKKKQKNEK